MVGALDATAMELDRVANQSPGSPDFWEVIKAVEFWERQHAALLNQGDPMSAIRRSSAGAAVLLGDPGVAGKEPSVVCTWCSQRGHLEKTCIREPRCTRCFGPHPERNHDAIVMADQAYFQPRAMDGKRDARGSFSDSRGRDSRSQRDYMPRGSRPPQDAAGGDGKRRDNPRGIGGHPPRKLDNDGARKCFACGSEGHIKRDCPAPNAKRNGDGRMQAQAHVAVVPDPPTPVPPARDRSPEADRDALERLKDLEQWRRSLEQTRKRRSDQPTELERATKVVLSSLGRGKVFDPFE